MSWEEIALYLWRPIFTLGNTPVTLASLSQFVVIVLLVMVMASVISRALRTRILSRTKLSPGAQYGISRIVGYIVLVLGLAVALSTLGVDLTALAVLGGALGVGIGFGLQNIVNNFVSGLIILVERPIQLGDRVEVDDVIGDIVRIGARSTSVLTNDNIVIIVPNSEFISGKVINWDANDDNRVRFRIPVGVSYGSEPRQVEKALLEAAAENPHVLKEPAPAVCFSGFGDSSLDFELRVWTIDLAHRPGSFRSQLYFAIWDNLKQYGIEVPFPQRDLHIKEPVRVELAGEAGQPSES